VYDQYTHLTISVVSDGPLIIFVDCSILATVYSDPNPKRRHFWSTIYELVQKY